MKKRFVKILSLLIALVIGSSVMAGCNLVTTDIDRDMDRVVATINVSGKEGEEDTITKRDMVMQYMNYGRLYVEYYGYTPEKAYELILDNLLQTKIMVQHVKNEYENKDGAIVNANETGLAKYLKADDIIEAKYNAYKSVNDLLSSYEIHDHDEVKQDTIIGEVRTTPTGAANKALEVSKEQKVAYVKKYEANGFELKTSEQIGAYNKVVEVLESYSLLGDYDGDLRKSTYFTGTLESNYENTLIKYYEDGIRDEIIKSLDYDRDIVGLFDKTKDEQNSMTNKEFVDALSSATMTSPVLVGNAGTYGYVYNILLGASTKQTDDIAKIKTDKPNVSGSDFAKERAKILKDDTIIKDLRSSWIQSGYDFDGKYFTGDYTLVKDAKNSLEFFGTVSKIKDEVKDEFGIVTETAKYAVDSVKDFNLAEFIDMVENYVGGTIGTEVDYDGFEDVVYDKMDYQDDIYRSRKFKDKDTFDKVKEYDAKIQELLFAFSTDPGSLNTYKGYLIKPPVDGADSEEFVKTFGDAGRQLLEKGSGYVVVASDYGYHLMFYSEKIDGNFGKDTTLDKYLTSLGIDNNGLTWKEYFNEQLKDWDKFVEEDNYLYYLASSLVSEKITEELESVRNNKINAYRYEENGGVVVDQKVYDSLLG